MANETFTCAHCGFGFVNQAISYAFIEIEPAASDGPLAVVWTTCTKCQLRNVYLGINNAPRNHVPTVVSRRLVHPAHGRKPALDGGVDPSLAEDFSEAFEVRAVSAKASAALSRRCLQRFIREHLKIKKGDLSSEIDEVLAQKLFPKDLAEDIDAIRHIGNFGAHPNKSLVTGEIVEVEDGEADWCLNVLEELFKFHFVSAAERKAKRTALDAKLAQYKQNVQMKKPPP